MFPRTRGAFPKVLAACLRGSPQRASRVIAKCLRVPHGVFQEDPASHFLGCLPTNEFSGMPAAKFPRTTVKACGGGGRGMPSTKFWDRSPGRITSDLESQNSFPGHDGSRLPETLGGNQPERSLKRGGGGESSNIVLIISVLCCAVGRAKKLANMRCQMVNSDNSGLLNSHSTVLPPTIRKLEINVFCRP